MPMNANHHSHSLVLMVSWACQDLRPPETCGLQLDATSHTSHVQVIPRGSNALVTHIKQNTKIPVMGHADGICHIYIDQDADLDLACKIVVDAKTDYPAACNAVEKVLVHKSLLGQVYKIQVWPPAGFHDLCLLRGLSPAWLRQGVVHASLVCYCQSGNRSADESTVICAQITGQIGTARVLSHT